MYLQLYELFATMKFRLLVATTALLLPSLISCDNAGIGTLTSTHTGLINEGKNKSEEFVDAIKRDLRRNNDDYFNIIKTNPYMENYKPYDSGASNNKIMNKNKQEFHFKENKKRVINRNIINDSNKTPQRRANSLEIFSDDTSISKPDEGNHDVNDTGIEFKAKDRKTNQIEVSNTPMKNNKVQKFLHRNKGLLQDFLSGRYSVTPKAAVTQEMGKNMLRQRPSLAGSPELQLPNGEQLDMSPAKGARIHALRIKGRLCQRHVLFPEGPKYDSKGNVYLPEHDPARVRGRDFARTKSPSVILPRCCNCCRKSVLGCE